MADNAEFKRFTKILKIFFEVEDDLKGSPIKARKSATHSSESKHSLDMGARRKYQN